jgi:hypothetical protein
MQQNILRLKEDIKRMVERQINTKAQRKQNYTGKRTYTQDQAAKFALDGKRELRHHYLAYALLREKTIDDVESNPKEPHSQYYLNKIITKYEKDVCDNEA